MAENEAGNAVPPRIDGADNSFSSSSFFAVGKYGTYMSLLMLIVGVVASMITQRYAPSYINLDSWNDGCSSDYEEDCKASSAVLRISFALTIMFILQTLGSIFYTKYYDYLWLGKFVVFFCVVVGFFFGNSSTFGTDGYAWLARLTGFLYLILQQVILLDMAYTWNESWLSYSVEEGEEKGKKWLYGLVFSSVVLFAGSISFIGVMFWQFDGCTSNMVILSLSVILPTIATAIQLFCTDEGSILTSAIMTAYSTYVCYSAVSLNPELSCNPTIDTKYQDISTVIGLVLLVASITWTTYNTVHKIPTAKGVNFTNISTTSKQSNPTGEASESSRNENTDSYNVPGIKSLFVQVSFVFLLISGYYAMVLTNWATEQSDNSIDNPQTGRAAMWIQAAGSWIAILLYLWSLIAPKLFPDRDFN